MEDRLILTQISFFVNIFTHRSIYQTDFTKLFLIFQQILFFFKTAFVPAVAYKAFLVGKKQK